MLRKVSYFVPCTVLLQDVTHSSELARMNPGVLQPSSKRSRRWLPENVDRDFLAALPGDLREEVLEEQWRLLRENHRGLTTDRQIEYPDVTLAPDDVAMKKVEVKVKGVEVKVKNIGVGVKNLKISVKNIKVKLRRVNVCMKSLVSFSQSEYLEVDQREHIPEDIFAPVEMDSLLLVDIFSQTRQVEEGHNLSLGLDLTNQNGPHCQSHGPRIGLI